MIVQRVEKQVIKKNNYHYAVLDDFCFKSKNLYNHANYLVRNEFIKNDKWLKYSDLDKMLKADIEYPDYRQMPTAQAAQQILRLLDKNWKSFFKSIKDWSKHKDKYLGRPKLPKYKGKNDRFMLILTNQNVKLKDGILYFPKVFEGFILKPVFVNRKDFVSFQQIRVLPKRNHFIIELIYNIEVQDEKLCDNGKYAGVDIGLDNLATITNNIGLKPVIINGKGLKSMNKYYNKQISHCRELAKRMNNTDYTFRMDKLTVKRNSKVNDYMHKAGRYIIDCCLKNDIHTLVIGNNKNWKQESGMGKNVNQTFVGIPHQRLIEMLKYKAETVGLNIIITEESYTSGTSFIDNEEPIKKNYDKSRRIYRGLFVSNNGIKINADVNGSMQIIKKVFPNAFADGIEGVVLHPIRVNVA